jgi:hypothetical protein
MKISILGKFKRENCWGLKLFLLFESQNKHKVLFLTKLPDVDNLLGINEEGTGK